MTAYTPVDHPGTTVPAGLHTWDTPWPAYNPIDITPKELQPAALTSPASWVEDLQTDPAQVPDWDRRRAQALVPYRLDVQGRPLNPVGRTGRTGRNLKAWGENQAADPIVIAGSGSDRRVLLIRRDDNFEWAIPGGMVDPGEAAPTTLTRELYEETGVDLSDRSPKILFRGYVDDWRATDWSWVCTTAAIYRLEDVLPAIAGDDAADSAWWPWNDDIDALAARLETHGGLYEAHRPLLSAAAA